MQPLLAGRTHPLQLADRTDFSTTCLAAIVARAGKARERSRRSNRRLYIAITSGILDGEKSPDARMLSWSHAAASPIRIARRTSVPRLRQQAFPGP